MKFRPKYFKKVSTLSLLLVSFIAGLMVTYLYFQPKLIYQGKTAEEWSNVAGKEHALAVQSQKEASTSSLLLASASAQIKTLLAIPPKIEYRTQYVQAQPSTNLVYCPPLFTFLPAAGRCVNAFGLGNY